jgi:hypothetical protein
MAAIQKDQNRQWPLSLEKTFNHDDDFGDDSAAQTAVVVELARLPVGARVVGGEIVVEEAWDNGTTATVDIGDVTDPDRYTASPVNLTALGRTALTLDGFKTTEVERDVDLTPVFAGANGTQGRAYVRIEYVIENKANEVQPLDVDEYGSVRTAV